MDHPSGSTIPSIFRNASTTRSVPKSVRSFDESPSSPTSSSSGFTGKNIYYAPEYLVFQILKNKNSI